MLQSLTIEGPKIDSASSFVQKLVSNQMHQATIKFLCGGFCSTGCKHGWTG